MCFLTHRHKSSHLAFVLGGIHEYDWLQAPMLHALRYLSLQMPILRHLVSVPNLRIDAQDVDRIVVLVLKHAHRHVHEHLQ